MESLQLIGIALFAIALSLIYVQIRKAWLINKDIESEGKNSFRKVKNALETSQTSSLKVYGVMMNGKYRLAIIDESAGPDESRYILCIVLEKNKVTVVEQSSPEEYTWQVFFTRELKRLLVMIEHGLI